MFQHGWLVKQGGGRTEQARKGRRRRTRITTRIATRTSASHLRTPHHNRVMAVTAPRRREKGRCHEMVPRGGRISNEAAPTTMHSPYRLVSSGKRDGEPEIHGPRAGGITTPRAGGITTPRACASRHLARAHHNTSRARASRQDSEHHNTSRAAVRAHHNRTPGIEGPRGCAFYVHPNSPSSPSYACDDTGLFMFRCSQSRGHESVQIMRSCADLLPDLRKS